LLFQFDYFSIDADRRELKGSEGVVHVEPQVFDLLLHFVRNTDRVISKDELIETVWKGRIVSDAALNSRINSARRAIGDTGEKQALIRTVQRRGFLFTAEVTTRTGDPASSAAAADARSAPDPRHLALPDKPSIAVLPFQNLSGDPEQDYSPAGGRGDHHWASRISGFSSSPAIRALPTRGGLWT
jgi:DNA-binding winged helix-turn-helix (wHTH) protein